MLQWRRDRDIHVRGFIDYERCVGGPSMGCNQHRGEDHAFHRMDGASKYVGVLEAYQH